LKRSELEDYIELGIELGILERQISELQSDITKIKTSKWTDEPRSSVPYTLEDRMVKLADLEGIYRKRWGKVIDLRIKIEKFIDGIENPINRAIFSLKYIDGCNFEEIGKTLGYVRETVSKRHSEVLRNSSH
jgi:DNA-directed RNA polymerase specialized sigma subunit